MRLLIKIVLAILGNLAGLLLAAHYVPGFDLAPIPLQILYLALALTLLNAFLRPILKLLMGPVIILTLGLGTILVNAAVLALLDFLAPSLSIQGVLPLLLGTLILAVANFVINIFTAI